MNYKKIAVFAAVSSFCAINVYASAPDNTWKIEIAPYLWAINMNGTVQVGPLTAPVKESFSDILSQFHGGGMLFIDANKNHWGLFFNALYADLVKNTPLSPFPLTVHSNNEFGIFSAGASYRINETIEPYVGARYTVNDTTLSISNPSLSVSDNQQWTDPIMGARIHYHFNQQWLALLAGDVGGINNHYSYNANGLIGYKPQSMQRTTLYIGYRYLYQRVTCKVYCLYQ